MKNNILLAVLLGILAVPGASELNSIFHQYIELNKARLSLISIQTEAPDFAGCEPFVSAYQKICTAEDMARSKILELTADKKGNDLKKICTMLSSFPPESQNRFK